MRSPRKRASTLCIAAVTIGLLLVAVGCVTVVSGRTTARSGERNVLSQDAARGAQAVSDYLARARSIALLTSHNPEFKEFYDLRGGRIAKLRGRSPIVRQLQAGLAYLSTLFPGSIGEASFVDRSGAENAIAVLGHVGSIAALSPDERRTPYFRPGFSLGAGEVYFSPTYVSAATHETVIAAATVVATARGNRGLIHFELSVRSFGRALAGVAGHSDVALIDGRTGHAVFESTSAAVRSRTPVLGSGGDRRVSALARHRRSGSLELGGHQVAYDHLAPERGNGSNWIVVARARKPLGSWLSGIGGGEFGLIALGIILLGFGILVRQRASNRDLVKAVGEDDLTGIGNRRRLMEQLEARARTASEQEPLLLALFDLDGFKTYNDSYGHPAGDDLLRRLAKALSIVGGARSAYRLGGDEFCLLTDAKSDQEALVERAAQALSESGEGFHVTASYGSVLLPAETSDPEEALRLADARMYARKSSATRSAGDQSAAVLLSVLSERNPDLGEHVGGVTALCESVARRLELTADDLATVLQAAALHDIGKAAIPDTILNKPGPLSEDEWRFMRQHTVLGERIMEAAPALTKAAKLVRSSHERFDGGGYPDGLAGSEIVRGARIIFACDAFDAMVSDRPYRQGMSVDDALEELDANAGSQFDPEVVSALRGVVIDGHASAEPGPRSKRIALTAK